MPESSGTPRFLARTRGQIVRLLRRQPRTVSELAVELQLTDNAVRAQLSGLERDGLVEQSGIRRGLRKPHTAYALTQAARELFPQPYGPLLDLLLDVLVARHEPAALNELLEEVGHRLAAGHLAHLEGVALQERLEAALELLGELGGIAELEQREGKWFIKGYGCPLSVVVNRHPQVCRLAETFLTDITGVQIKECCDRAEPPRCCFEVVTDQE